MGVDITTYHSRIGTFKHTCGQYAVTITCFISFSAGLKTTGSVAFIGLLLLIAGIESNPGPNEIKRIILTIAILLCACVYVQRLDYVLYTVCILIVVNIYCGGIVNGIDPDISHEGPQKQFNQLNEEIEQMEDDKSVEDENELGSESFGDFGILSKETRPDVDHEHTIAANVPENASPPEHDNEGESEGGNDKVEIPSGKYIPKPASTSETGPSISNNKENSLNGENDAAPFETGNEETATGKECLGSESDITELDKGSDEIVTNALKPMSDEERKSAELLWKDKDFKQGLNDKSFRGVFDKKMVQWQNEDVYVAVLGRTGVGKSRFINAFRCCTSKKDPLYAPVGSVETTKEAKAYPHPKNPRLILWDLPGIGTQSFRRENYVKDKKIDFTNYHIYLIMASDRFTQDDIYLAEEIEKIGKKFLFVRTRVDINLDDVAEEKDEVETIREDCIKSLSNAKFKSNEVYLISSKFVNHEYLDFAKLLERLVLSLAGLKKDVMLYSLQFNTKLFIESKATALQSRIKYVCLRSAAVGGLPIPGFSLMVDCFLISKELDFYRKTLGVTKSDLRKLAEKTNKTVDDLKAEYKLKTFDSYELTGDVTKFGIQYGHIFREIAISETVETTIKLLVPVIGSIAGAGISWATTYHFLKSILDLMVEDARQMMSILLEETGNTVLPLNQN